MYFEDFHIGQEFPIPPFTITKPQMMKFAKTYDPMPAHMDAEHAKTTKFGDIIAPGIMSFMAVWANFVRMDILGKQFLAGKSFKIEWLAPCYEGDVITGTAEITKMTRRNPYNGLVYVRIYIKNQNDIMVMDTVTEALMQCRPQLINVPLYSPISTEDETTGEPKESL